MVDLGYGDMWDCFEKQAAEENWSPEQKRRIASEISDGIQSEISELAELGVLKR